MNYHVMTLFPEMFNAIKESILGRAIKNNYITFEAVNIRDFAFNKHNKVDDYTYGGGAGMLMQAEPVYLCFEDISKRIKDKNKMRVIYMTPQGQTLNQNMAKEFAKEEDIVILCGHYEGIDERVLEEIVTDYVSIGDYVLTGGEIPAMAFIDCVSRFVDGVLSNDESALTESFYNGLLEYPQYSRPEVWHDKKVPEVLLSGDHAKVEEWRFVKSMERTKERRIDIYEKFCEDNKEMLEKRAKKQRDKERRKLRKALKANAENNIDTL